MTLPPEPGLAMPSVLGSHLLLNLREAYYKPYTVGTLTTRSLELPTIGRSAKVIRPGLMSTPWAIHPGGVRRSHVNTSAMVDAVFPQGTYVYTGPDTSTTNDAEPTRE